MAKKGKAAPVDYWGAMDAKAVRREQRICFGIAWFATEADADEVGALVRKAGVTYNGGWFHGMACGRDPSKDHSSASGKLFAVTY